jgi:uronate dehydrogenase
MAADRDADERLVLLTGAAGRIGSLLRRDLPTEPGLRLRVVDRVDPGPGEGRDEVHVGDLADAAFVEGLFEDGRVGAVIHLAGYPREADWDVLLDANMKASIHLWEAARRHGVDRVVYASSNHAIGLYPRALTIDDEVLPRPDSRYGLTKVFCEQMAFLYAHKFGVRGFCMRIGAFRPEPDSERALATWISPRDLVALVRVGLTADYVFEVVYGVSANARSFWDNRNAWRLGYRPQDSADAHAPRFEAPGTDDLAALFQGGPYVLDGLATDPDQLARLARKQR